MKKPALGEQELETLRFIAEHAPISVGEVASRFGEPRGLARTTILTVMERLRQKGYLTRRKDAGTYQYIPQDKQSDVLKDLVRDFVETRLAGSLSPFVAYLSESEELSEEEVASLRKLVAGLPAGKTGQP